MRRNGSSLAVRESSRFMSCGSCDNICQARHTNLNWIKEVMGSLETLRTNTRNNNQSQQTIINPGSDVNEYTEILASHGLVVDGGGEMNGILGRVVGMVGTEGIVVGMVGNEVAGKGGSVAFGMVGMVGFGRDRIWVLGKGGNVGFGIVGSVGKEVAGNGGKTPVGSVGMASNGGSVALGRVGMLGSVGIGGDPAICSSWRAARLI
ncbi:hypothetical protein RJ639_011236 [Escallonia herrerae]|uniref:Uncharacterized protein n=1 Tax=Escallonia herrerae TaxID=1293975 RepID=A0AA88VQW9_9ASTE|nr:hypothetical protein RJ639_011236 [Escallonia herrerae]